MSPIGFGDDGSSTDYRDPGLAGKTSVSPANAFPPPVAGFRPLPRSGLPDGLVPSKLFFLADGGGPFVENNNNNTRAGRRNTWHARTPTPCTYIRPATPLAIRGIRRAPGLVPGQDNWGRRRRGEERGRRRRKRCACIHTTVYEYVRPPFSPPPLPSHVPDLYGGRFGTTDSSANGLTRTQFSPMTPSVPDKRISLAAPFAPLLSSPRPLLPHSAHWGPSREGLATPQTNQLRMPVDAGRKHRRPLGPYPSPSLPPAATRRCAVDQAPGRAGLLGCGSVTPFSRTVLGCG